ncbi:MAG: hypothetical protein A2V70_12420 [Planctomycetes bacterium RBG_13_63_9]|nr:MAG: hypothetical protein A2V70_12420 [Planctomycetes bacterium RBG_13_63_9]
MQTPRHREGTLGPVPRRANSTRTRRDAKIGLSNTGEAELKLELLLNGEHVAWHTVNVFPPADEASDAAVDLETFD